MEDIINIIQTVGFPIAACVFMWRYINNALKEFSANINENTKMLTRIYERLTMEDENE